MNIITHQTDHFEDRKDGVAPSFVIVHFTEVTFEETHQLFTGEVVDDSAGRVSAHYVIDYDGSIHRYVPEDKRAWHAGVSSWGDVTEDMNSHSIGIELVNSGDEPFPQQQIDALIVLIGQVMQRHDIGVDHVLGHDEIAPDRKVDPGPLFPWKDLAEKSAARWPRPVNPALLEDVKKLANNDLSP